MPIEIREVVIRADVRATNSGFEDRKDVAQTVADKELIVQECVEQVMQILRDKKER